MADAKPGRRVANRDGATGVIVSVNRYVAHVKWDDGFKSYVMTDTLHPIGGPRWGLYVLGALLLGLFIALGVWLL